MPHRANLFTSLNIPVVVISAGREELRLQNNVSSTGGILLSVTGAGPLWLHLQHGRICRDPISRLQLQLKLTRWCKKDAVPLRVCLLLANAGLSFTGFVLALTHKKTPPSSHSFRPDLNLSCLCKISTKKSFTIQK